MSFLDRLSQWFTTPSPVSKPAQATVAVVEPIDILAGDGTTEENVLAYLDTGEELSQIDQQFATEQGLYSAAQVVDRVPSVNPATGREKLTDQIEVIFTLAGREYRSRWLVTDRQDCKQLVLLGKEDLRGLSVMVPEVRE